MKRHHNAIGFRARSKGDRNLVYKDFNFSPSEEGKGFIELSSLSDSLTHFGALTEIKLSGRRVT
jgi:hypothetical protein